MSSTRSRSDKYILLKTFCPKKENPYLLHLQGEILEEFFERDQLEEDHDTVILSQGYKGTRQECPVSHVMKLTDVEADLLMAVTSPEDRLRTFRERSRLEDGKFLTTGRKVFVTLEGREVPGVIIFKGHLTSAKGIFFGVNLLDENAAEGDRVVKLVAVDKIRQRPESEKKSTRSSRNRKNKAGLNEVKKDLRKAKKRECELEAMLKKEMEAHLETEKRLQENQRKVLGEVEAKLATERKAHEETKRLLQKCNQVIDELNITLEITQQVLVGTEKKLSTSHEFGKEREQQSPEELEMFFQTSELDATIGTSERETHKQKNSCLKTTEQKLTEFERIPGQNDYEKKLLEEYKMKIAELEKTLKALKEQGFDKHCNWILKRDEITLTEDKLGSGVFGTVYKGRFRCTEVAVKKVSGRPRLSDYNRNKHNFKREIRMASRCQHPCIVQFIGAINDDESLLLVTELMDTSLKKVLDKRALERTEIITIARDVARGLNYLHLTHPNPIVHRDISSGNVLLWKHGQSWRAKVSDLGHAVLMNYARTGSDNGPYLYMAPELRQQKFSTECDVYSYGVLLLKMCIRNVTTDNKDEVISEIKDENLRNLVRKCLQEQPKERPSMNEIISILEEI